MNVKRSRKKQNKLLTGKSKRDRWEGRRWREVDWKTWTERGRLREREVERESESQKP